MHGLSQSCPVFGSGGYPEAIQVDVELRTIKVVFRWFPGGLAKKPHVHSILFIFLKHSQDSFKYNQILFAVLCTPARPMSFMCDR